MCDLETYWIPLQSCINGNMYRICARNSSHGIFNKKTKSFIIARTKFRDTYTFEEEHWDLGEPYGTVKPLEDLGPSNMMDATEDEQLEYLIPFRDLS